MRAGAQERGEILDRGIRNDGVASGGDDEDRLADARREARLAQYAHGAERGVAPRHGRSAERERGLRLEDGRVAGIAYRIRRQDVADEGAQVEHAGIASWHIHAAEAAQ